MKKKNYGLYAAVIVITLLAVWFIASWFSDDKQQDIDVKESLVPASVSGSGTGAGVVSAPAGAVVASEPKVVYEETFAFSGEKKYFSAPLDERKRFKVTFETDNPIRFVMYNKARFDDWSASGVHTMSKITTNSASGCCASVGAYSVDINQGEGGDYYFVFDTSDIVDKKDLPKEGKLVVTELSSI
jgi:hypothetical protein